MNDQTIMDVAVDAIVCRAQVRSSLCRKDVAELMESIRLHGLLMPLLGYQDGDAVVLLEGHHRLEACKRLGHATVPVVVGASALGVIEVPLRQAILNGQRKELSPIERARVIHRLMQVAEWSLSETARQLTVSPGYATKLVSLLELPESVQQLIHCGALSPTVGYALARAGEPELVERLAAEIAKEELTREEALERLGKARGAAQAKRIPFQVIVGVKAGREARLVSPEALAMPGVIELLEQALAKAKDHRDRGLGVDALRSAEPERQTGALPSPGVSA